MVEPEIEVGEIDVFDRAFGRGVDDHRVFAVARDVRKTEIANGSRHAFASADGRDLDRFAVAPPVARVQACVDVEIREIDVFQPCVVADADADAAVGVEDGDVREVVVRHYVLVPAADADGTRP